MASTLKRDADEIQKYVKETWLRQMPFVGTDSVLLHTVVAEK